MNANEKIRLIVNKLIEEYEAGPYGIGPEYVDLMNIVISDFIKDINVSQQQLVKILEKLQSKDILSIMDILPMIRPSSSINEGVCVLLLRDQFRSTAEKYLKTLPEVHSLQNTGLNAFIYLDKNGDLWHGNKEKFCYPMLASKGRLALVKFLADNGDYQATSLIASSLNRTSQNIRIEIGKIKVKVKEHLKIEDFIENDRNLGYRINPKYQIKVTG